MNNKYPPPLPTKNFRLAATLNLFLPGSGLFYLGHRLVGALLAVAFLLCLVASLAIFLIGYAQYFTLALDGQILEGDKLEKMSALFRPRWLVGLLVAGVVIYLISLIFLSRARRKSRAAAPPKPTV